MPDHLPVRTYGSQRTLAQRVLPWLFPIVILLMLAGGAYVYRVQDTARLTAVARADVAESRLAAVSGSLTAVVRAQAVASATALAESNAPGAALQRALGLAFAAYQQPTAQHLTALSDVFGPAALAIEQPEGEHLVSAGTHLGGSSTFSVKVITTTDSAPGQATVATQERWVYDERDGTDRRVRCVTEDSDQSYMMKLTGTVWIVDDIQLGSTHRTEC